MDKKELLEILEDRFISNLHRHPGIDWPEIEKIIRDDEKLISSLIWMEESGGKIDLILLKDKSLIFTDMSKESPIHRRSLCYDEKARINRKKNAPDSSVEQKCFSNGINLLTEDLYFEIQKIEDLDLKTSSWIFTPKEIRELGGAIFGDKRYKRTFIYHNGADSHYSSRGFRAYVKISS